MPDPIFVIPGFVVGAVAASWLADRLRIPSILILLALGVVIGPVLGLVEPSQMFGELLTPLVSVAVAVILFEGGLSLRLREIQGSQRIIWLLVSVGVLVTWVIGALAAWFFTDLGVGPAVLLGSILVVSGPTVVGPILRIVRPTRRIGSILKWESIFIDPVGAMLAVVTFNVISSGKSGPVTFEVALDVILFIADGVVSGALFAAVAVFVLRRHWVPEHLVSVFGLATALIAYMAAESIFHESGLLATTVVGLILTNHPRISTESIVRFSEVLRVLLIGVLFIVLSARLTREQLTSIGWGALGLVAALVLIARPLAAWLATWGSDLDHSKRLLIAGVAPRGIVAASIASVFGLELEAAGVPGAELITPLAFAVIVATVLIYGFGSGPLARWLGEASAHQEGVLVLGAGPVERAVAAALHGAGVDVVIATVSRSDELRARTSGLRTFFGNVLDEDIDLRLDLSGIGRLFALTPNDEVNTLAVRRFTDIFGRGDTYQLSPADSPEGVDGGMADLGGRLVFDAGATYDQLRDRLNRETINSMSLADSFELDSFRVAHGEAALPLFALRESRLMVAAVDAPNPLTARLQPGDRLFWLGEEKQW
ncbi:MAG: cation:proton antiporter [Acidimicrobiia bacterium]